MKVKLLSLQKLLQIKGDILVGSNSGCGDSCEDAPLANPDRLWPGGVVDYQFYKTFPRCFNLAFRHENMDNLREHRTVMKKAMNYISDRTSCVKFVPWTPSSLNYVTIAPSGRQA